MKIIPGIILNKKGADLEATEIGTCWPYASSLMTKKKSFTLSENNEAQWAG